MEVVPWVKGAPQGGGGAVPGTCWGDFVASGMLESDQIVPLTLKVTFIHLDCIDFKEL